MFFYGFSSLTTFTSPKIETTHYSTLGNITNEYMAKATVSLYGFSMDYSPPTNDQ